MLNNYSIQGKAPNGMWIKEIVEASNEKHALSLVHKKYGKLTKLDIFIITELQEPLEEIERTSKYFSSSGYNDEDIIEMIKQINNNEDSQEYQSAFTIGARGNTQLNAIGLFEIFLFFLAEYPLSLRVTGYGR